jgi:hypothetical protein
MGELTRNLVTMIPSISSKRISCASSRLSQ